MDVDWCGDNQVGYLICPGGSPAVSQGKHPGTLLASLIVEASLIHVVRSEQLVCLTVLVRMWVIKGRTVPDSTGHILLSLSVFFFLTLLAILVLLSILFIFF